MNEEATRLVELHRGYVRALAKQIARQLPPNADMEELIAAGQVGLVEAATRYDAAHGVAFQTFAYYRIRGAIFDGLRKMLWLPPSLYKKLRFQAGADQIAREQLGTAADDEAPEAQATRLAGTVKDLAAIYILSLDAELSETDPTAAEDPTAPAELSEEITRLRAAIETLPERKQRVIRGYYLEGRKLTEIAAELGVSRFQASRLHTEAVRELRTQLEDSGGTDP